MAEPNPQKPFKTRIKVIINNAYNQGRELTEDETAEVKRLRASAGLDHTTRTT